MTAKSIFKSITFFLILLTSAKAQSDPILTEIMFRPNGSNTEFVELYNPTANPIDLTKYQIKYSTSSGDYIIQLSDPAILAPNSFAVVVEGDYDPNNSPYTIPASALIVQLDDNAFGSSGMANTADRDVYLLDNTDAVISTYTYSADNSDGISDEKIVLNTDNSSSNWANSTVVNGTPGYKNSVSPKDKDLAVTEISITPTPSNEDIDLAASVKIENLGTQNAAAYDVELYFDENLDSTPQLGELVNTFSLTNLGSGNSVTQNFSIGNFSTGDYRLIAVVNFAGDEDNANNQFIKNFTVNPNPPFFNAIVINEIMYDPSTGEPEWIELYNRTGFSYSIKDWSIADASSQEIITDMPNRIQPNEYIIIAENASINDYFDINSKVFINDLPSLNNTGDKLILYDFNSDVVDSLTYDDAWGGGDGKSLERISPVENSYNPNNWGTSISSNNATPGSINSISTKNYDLSIENMEFTPVPAIEGDDITIRVLTKNLGLQNSDEFTVHLYLDLNQDSVFQGSEEISSLSQQLAAGDSGFVDFQFPNVAEGKYFFITNIEYNLDEYNYNNTYYSQLVVGGKPLEYNTLIINEIMYSPQDDEPEWIEIYNRSSDSVNIKGWHISDASSKVKITSDDIKIAPQTFLVIAGNEKIKDYYNFSIPFITANLPSLNNSGDSIFLSDSLSFVNDSLSYTSSWGGTNGISLERLDPDTESILQSNWGSSISPDRATPGKVNSIIPREFDLAVTYFDSPLSFLFKDEETVFKARVKNVGSKTISGASLKVYYDVNDDSTFTQDELISEITNIDLPANIEIEKEISYTFTQTGTAYLLAKVNSDNDNYTINDSLFLSKEIIEPNVNRGNIVINEFLYAPNSPYPEWVELYNTSNIPQQLRNFSIADSKDTVLISSQNILIPGNSFIVIADDSIFSKLYDTPSSVLITEFPSLNNSGDRIMLLDNYNRVIDSLEYNSSWGGNNGKSLERIDPFAESTLQSNWGTSISPNGATPGEPNSVVPRDFDIAVTYFDSPSSFLLKDEESVFTVRLKNTGVNTAADASLKIYIDANGDSLFTINELLKDFSNIELAPAEEIEKSFTITFSTTGSKYMLAVSNYGNDVYPENDSLFLTKEVIEPNVNRGNIVINEFLYAPNSPYAEWIELYNTTNIPQQLRNFSIADSRDTVGISTQNILIPENSYIVIAKDSIITQLYDIPSSIIVTGFPSLNNSGDRIMLLDNYKRVIDSLEYTSGWGGNDGKSLERINPFGNSSMASNWATSIDSDLGTPGKVNSVAPKDYDIAIDDFYSTPAQPAKGETVSLSAKVVNAGINAAAFSIILYESNSAGDKVQSLETIQVDNLSPAEERAINFEYKIESFSTDKFFIVKVQFEEDQNTINNSKFLLVASPTTPLSLVINEIMFDPDGDEPEWIELYNRSSSSINLKDWQVSDVITNPVIETISKQDVFVKPGEYIVLAKDSNIFDYHPGLTRDQVILVSFATLNNTNDGVVIYERLGNVIDSVFYGDNFSKKSGYSIERLSTEGNSNSPSNWAISVSTEKGTPGFINSTVPKNHDLASVDISISPEFPELGNSITISASIQNLGLVDASSFTVTFVSSELGIDETVNVQSLAIGKTEIVSLPYSYNMPESFGISVQVNYAEDENLSNNTLAKTFYSGFSPSSVLINEVMYDPNADGTEWVEFINATNYGINLYGWKVAEGSTYNSPRTFNEEDIVIQPGEYFVIADDTSGGKFADVSSPVFEVNFGELNSSEDIVAIFDFRGALIDSLKYSSSWGGGDGYSLERVSVQSSTNLRTNWLPSIVINGSTPGSPNSTASITQSEGKQIVINEIMFEPETDNSEFIEFFNTSDQFVEIANWTVEDNSKNNTILTRNTFTISPESYFVVAADSSILLNYPELKEFNQLLIVNRNLSLNNTDDLILLSDAFGDVIDSVYYNSLWHNQKVITTKNKSLERINPFLNGNDNNNWSTSVASEGATPGKANSIFIENKTSNNAISVSPNPFSPDGDGYEDFVIINYNLPRDVTSIQIKVFDSKGRKVRTINENNIFSKQGSIIFDGYNDDGQPLKIGIYILFIEALNSSSGTVDTFKEVVVVARKL